VGNVNVVQVSADRVTLSAPNDTRIVVEATIECPLIEVADNLNYVPCGPTTKSATYTVGPDTRTSINIVEEFLKNPGLPLTLPLRLLCLLFLILVRFFKWLGADWPDPGEIKKQLKEIGAFT